jgi:hypothetical protein
MRVIFILMFVAADSPDFGRAITMLMVKEKKSDCEKEEIKKEENKMCEIKMNVEQKPAKGLESWDEAIQKLQQVQLEQKKIEETKTID